jgi:predicted AAA+ superfamily ATPase
MEQADELKEIWSRLSELSGFPEPYLARRMRTYRRWSNIYSQQLIREDIRDLTGVKSKETSARFENMVALELYRAVTAWNDMGHGNFSLHFIKNKEQQEVDFLIANDNEPFVLIEAKLSDTEPSQALKKFQGVLKKPAIQLVEESESYRMIPNGDQYILVAPAYQWLSNLP